MSLTYQVSEPQKVSSRDRGSNVEYFVNPGMIDPSRLILQDGTSTIIVRKSNFPTKDDYYSEIILKILEGYTPVNGRISKQIYLSYLAK